MTNIISLSGGKDSTAMLLMMIEKKIKVDHIVFFDTGWEFPEMIKHIDKLEKYIGREIVKLKPKIPFDKQILKYGFSSFGRRWCTSRKTDTIKKYSNAHKPNTQWIGFSYDEAKRIKKTIGYCYPLVDWKVTEEDALKYCFDKGFDWDDLYEKYNRVSCWNCPLQSLKDLKALWLYFPEYWQRLLKMQKQSEWQFRKDYTLEELDERFRREESIINWNYRKFVRIKMKKYRLQEGIAWICFKCGKKISSKEDMVWYDHRLYHRECALTLLEKIKKKVIKRMLGKK